MIRYVFIRNLAIANYRERDRKILYQSAYVENIDLFVLLAERNNPFL